jgi:hypothetical protein
MQMQIGDVVSYSSVIGDPPVSHDHEIIHIIRTPNNFGADVAWITDKTGCVALRALTPQDG